MDGIVSSIVESGYLYLQLNPDIISSLAEILPNEECLYPDYFLKTKDEIEKDQVYIVKYKNEDIWCRVQVVELKNDTKVS